MVPASAEYGVPGADDEGIFADIAQGAKTSVDITYWPQALRARVELRTRCPNGSTGSTTRCLLEPIGNLPPDAAEAADYAQLELTYIAA